MEKHDTEKVNILGREETIKITAKATRKSKILPNKLNVLYLVSVSWQIVPLKIIQCYKKEYQWLREISWKLNAGMLQLKQTHKNNPHTHKMTIWSNQQLDKKSKGSKYERKYKTWIWLRIPTWK